MNAFGTANAFIFSNHGDAEISKFTVSRVEVANWLVEDFGKFDNRLLATGRAFIACLTETYRSCIGKTARMTTLAALSLWQCTIDLTQQ